MLSSSLPTDVLALQQLLAAETQNSQLVCEKIAALEREIQGLKSALTCAQGVVVQSPAAGTQKFSGEIILVVDDQDLNLNLVSALLEDEHLVVVCKNSAQEALDYLKQNMPAVILMDIQMPQMDGYTATAKIRTDYGQNRPVILAMTANDSASDKQKCLGAGMQGHISKPIGADYLIEQLHFWLARDLNSTPETNSSTRTPAEDAALVSTSQSQTSELPGIDLPAALARLRDNRPLLEEVLVSFTQKAAFIIPEIHSAMADHDLAQTTRILHRLKGTSANLSAYKVAPLASELEAQCKNNCLPTADQLAQLELGINELIATAQHLQQSAIVSAPEQAVEHTLIEPLLKSIIENLHCDLGKAEEAVEELGRLCTNSAWAGDSARLRELFYQFNLRAVKDLIAQGFQG